MPTVGSTSVKLPWCHVTLTKNHVNMHILAWLRLDVLEALFEWVRFLNQHIHRHRSRIWRSRTGPFHYSTEAHMRETLARTQTSKRQVAEWWSCVGPKLAGRYPRLIVSEWTRGRERGPDRHSQSCEQAEVPEGVGCERVEQVVAQIPENQRTLGTCRWHAYMHEQAASLALGTHRVRRALRFSKAVSGIWLNRLFAKFLHANVCDVHVYAWLVRWNTLYEIR
jgi:hypothetical protein